MKYGESFFDIAYLVFAVTCGCLILRRAKSRAEKLMGLAALILGLGDAFHLVPRVLNYFVAADFTAALGLGKLVTSVTMTVFYVLLVALAGELFSGEKRRIPALVWVLLALRVVLCAFPQNGWLQNSGTLLWAVLRNVPFVILGALVCLQYYRNRQADGTFRLVWLYILLSFLFYIPVSVAAGIVPMLGMLMLPKTVCYVLILCVFLRAARQGR